MDEDEERVARFFIGGEDGSGGKAPGTTSSSSNPTPTHGGRVSSFEAEVDDERYCWIGKAEEEEEDEDEEEDGFLFDLLA